MPVSLLACMIVSANHYHIPPRVLPVIQKVEGGVTGMVHPNGDGSADLGLMQINTRWVQPLADIRHLSVPATATRLISDPCFNVAASALIMRTYIDEAHGDVMRAIGYYHSHTPTLSAAYRRKVLNMASSMFAANK
ncbi:lytic transglycosylase [Acetobacter malorum]|uniref:Lytic transglycosylase n=1 Tax=Acetobacter malorum TaxID=178901 RepID=A0A087PQZ3_9PROT|nr:lytic transglycosylase domain-containing protein [Acetobacter malorum]KFL89796.1 BfpH protein (involved in biogenesis of type IV pili) [Acetobacter malorum]KXV14736.1 lytic transglycosylase [Acetobacter malorum]KXV73843.1 lytic transglycosylase [Acetobacter malorum]